MPIRIAAVVCAAWLAALASVAAKAPTPAASFHEKPVFVQLDDGTLLALFLNMVDGTPTVREQHSSDTGKSWTDLEPVLALDPEIGGWTLPEALVDREGALHLFFLNDEGTGVILAKPEYRGPRRLCIYHARRDNEESEWTEPKRIWEGYTGALNSVIQMDSGRILLPFSYMTDRNWGNRGEGLDAFTFRGKFVSTLVYSDDGGATWALSPAQLTAPTPDIVSAYGAVEPVVIQLASGRVWMLIRTQQGRFYESFSDDGIAWPQAQPSSIESSDSPAGIVRVPDGRLVLLWNNCHRFPYAHGGRHVLHAAVSSDEGRTWRGYREIARDPLRDEPPPPRGDHGTAYPFPTALSDGRVLFATGQGEVERVACMLLEPDWLLETRQQTTFADGLDDWSVFGTRGVTLEPHPENPQTQVLRIQKTDVEWPACAVWNFPAGRKGRLEMRLKAEDMADGIHIGLTDHYSVPFDQEDVYHNVFNYHLAAFKPGAWHTVTFEWDCDAWTCTVRVDDAPIDTVRQRRLTPGLSYFRIKSAAGGLPNDESLRDVAPDWVLDQGPCLIESVAVDVSSGFAQAGS